MSKKTDEKDGWIKVGVVGVDAGLIWLGDPCYIMHEKHTKDDKPKAKPKAVGKYWLDFCDKIDNSKPYQQFNYDAGHPGLGVLTRTGYGDGEYDVFVKLAENGTTVAELKVVFIDELNDEEQEYK